MARQTGFDRETVSKYWNEYRRRLQLLKEAGVDKRAIQDSLFSASRRVATPRTSHNYAGEVDERLKETLKEEEKKTRLLGPNHKQKLTNRQIHQKLVSEGFDVSEGTINMALSRIRKRQREVFIRQRYDFGDRLEYDFWEGTVNHYRYPENLSYGGAVVTRRRISMAVSEYLVGKKVYVKKYHDEIRIVVGTEIVAKHKRVFGQGKMQVDTYYKTRSFQLTRLSRCSSMKQPIRTK